MSTSRAISGQSGMHRFTDRTTVPTVSLKHVVGPRNLCKSFGVEKEDYLFDEFKAGMRLIRAEQEKMVNPLGDACDQGDCDEQ